MVASSGHSVGSHNQADGAKRGYCLPSDAQAQPAPHEPQGGRHNPADVMSALGAAEPAKSVGIERILR